MSIFEKFSKKRPTESVDRLNVVIKTNKQLSDEQISTITSIVENGIKNNNEQSDIAIKIMLRTGIVGMISIERPSRDVVNVFL